MNPEMKKLLTIALAIVLALTLATGAFAIYGEDASGDDAVARLEAGIAAAAADINVDEIDDVAAFASDTFNALWNELLDIMPEDELVYILDGLLRDIDLDNDLSDADRDYIVDAFISRLPIDAEGGLADRISNMMSNDFLSFLAGLYVPYVERPETTTPEVIRTGDSSVIAIAAFATISVAAAAAFVLLKKKEK